MNINQPNQHLVVNWHLMEPCQLNCKYCYAEWSKEKLPVVFRDREKSKQLVVAISRLAADGRRVRLSFAGGEPLLDQGLPEKIRWADESGLKVSLITNGDFLPRKGEKLGLQRVEMIGVSIDSFDPATNRSIGRKTGNNQVPDYEGIVDFLDRARQNHPRLKVKINTVVNRYNWSENLAPDIERIRPAKWKVLRVLPATSKAAAEQITDERFAFFRDNHRHLDYAVFEDNGDMLNSYLMIDPYGRFFFNKEKDYGYSDPILAVGVEKALRQVRFDLDKFNDRYDKEGQ